MGEEEINEQEVELLRSATRYSATDSSCDNGSTDADPDCPDAGCASY